MSEKQIPQKEEFGYNLLAEYRIQVYEKTYNGKETSDIVFGGGFTINNPRYWNFHTNKKINILINEYESLHQKLAKSYNVFDVFKE